MGTPVKVPPAASAYTAATQDPELRSQINMSLLYSGNAAKIQEQLLHSLNAHPTNWPSTVQAHALSLLRSGEATTFPALLRRVLDDIRQETSASSSSSSSSFSFSSPHPPHPPGNGGGNSSSFSSSSSSSSKSDGPGGGGAASTTAANAENATTAATTTTTNGTATAAATNGAAAAAAMPTGPGAPMPKKANGVDAAPSLAVPAPVIEEALKVTQDCLDQICKINDGGR